ncbi:hypothetical protein DERP_002698 [Dermatophagoides pteronyssinus]|uniref:Uncharacterized protein n=1 Tax=Dermatophagoides pteronyssinus TaxID=6956 RepID=A0ABQ8JVJ7_DERPT|nr:hypothetical protein DERP_002698 [Dermatophagoides pteronyssinus]
MSVCLFTAGVSPVACANSRFFVGFGYGSLMYHSRNNVRVLSLKQCVFCSPSHIVRGNGNFFRTRYLSTGPNGRPHSFLFNSAQFGCATGNDHKNRPNRSISPLSSRVSQTAATCPTVKFNVEFPDEFDVVDDDDDDCDCDACDVAANPPTIAPFAIADADSAAKAAAPRPSAVIPCRCVAVDPNGPPIPPTPPPNDANAFSLV